MFKELALKAKNSNITLNSLRLTFLLWCFSAIGVFEQYKAELAAKYDNHFMIYSVFWAILALLAYVFKLFYQAKTLDEISKALGVTITYLILPIIYALCLFVQIAIISLATLEPSFITFLTAGPSIILAWHFWCLTRDKIA